MTPRSCALAAAFALAAAPEALAHRLTVFASTDCAALTVEAKFSTGRVPVRGAVRIRDGENALLRALDLGPDGTLRVPLSELDLATGLVVEVDTGDHDDYWIMTPEDIARQCPS